MPLRCGDATRPHSAAASTRPLRSVDATAPRRRRDHSTDYAKVGVSIDGAASILEGVHTWNGGGVGIVVNGSYAIQDRLLGCYLDYNTLVLVDPSQTTVEDTFFLDTNAVLTGSQMAGVVFRTMCMRSTGPATARSTSTTR